MKKFRVPYQLITMKYLATDGSELKLTDPEIKTLQGQMISQSRYVCEIDGIHSHIITKVELPTFSHDSMDDAYAIIHCVEQTDIEWQNNNDEIKELLFGNTDFDRYKQWEIQ